MNTINIREFQRNMKSVGEKVAKGRSFLVLKNAKPVFEVRPVTLETHKKTKRTQKEFLRDLSAIRIHGEKDLSRNIDKIVYG